jgi:hypothetical protein
MYLVFRKGDNMKDYNKYVRLKEELAAEFEKKRKELDNEFNKRIKGLADYCGIESASDNPIQEGFSAVLNVIERANNRIDENSKKGAVLSICLGKFDKGEDITVSKIIKSRGSLVLSRATCSGILRKLAEENLLLIKSLGKGRSETIYSLRDKKSSNPSN